MNTIIDGFFGILLKVIFTGFLLCACVGFGIMAGVAYFAEELKETWE